VKAGVKRVLHFVRGYECLQSSISQSVSRPRWIHE